MDRDGRRGQPKPSQELTPGVHRLPLVFIVGSAPCYQIPCQRVPVGTIGKHAIGKGNADKEAMIAGVRARGFTPTGHNEADALALPLWATEHQET